MADSLAVAGQFELLGGGEASQLAQCAGAIFRLGTSTDADNYSLGAYQPTQDFVAQLAGLDGEQPKGKRSSNRQLTIPVTIKAASPAIVAAGREALAQAVNAESFQLIWTRDGGLPLIFDCYRATLTPVYSQVLEKNSLAQFTLTFPAAPYGKSDKVEVVKFDSPVSGETAAAAPVTLDDFITVSGTGWTASVQSASGTQSAFHAATSGFATYSKTFAAKDLSAQDSLTFYAGLGAASVADWYDWHRGPVQFSVTLTDSSARTTVFGAARDLTASNSPGAPAWAQITIPLPDDTAFDWGAVTGYSIVIHNFATFFFGRILTPALYLDRVQAVPSSLQVPAAVRGWVYNLNVKGSARTQLSLNIQQPEVSQPQTVTLTGAGKWIPPAGVATIDLVEMWAPGGAGGSRTTTGLGGGAGGGQYVKVSSLALTGSAPILYNCGAPGTPAGAGGTTVVLTYDTAGIAEVPIPSGVSTVQVETWGAGAGAGMGSSFFGQNAGGGGAGEYAKNTAVPVTGPGTYFATVGAGGNGAGGNGFEQTQSATDGGDSFFTGDSSTTVLGNGGSAGQATTFGRGGTGSAAPVHHDGGRGGSSSNSSAGGGGGSSGGTAAAGNNGGNASSGGSAGAGATAVTGGGAGGAGGANGNGHDGSGPGGGGGAGSNGTSAGDGADGQIIITYTLAATGVLQVDGSAATFGPVGSTTVSANGGKSVPLNTATHGLGGTGGSGGTRNDGGTGFTPTSGSGGGGGAGADSTGAGVSATAAAGAVAALDGGNGGAGSTGAGAGAAGQSPGGGGGGADSAGAAEVGGVGGPGQIRLTFTKTLAPFKTLIAHRPGPDAPLTLNPLVSFGGTDPPDGRLYPVASPVTGLNATFKGTYSVWVVGYAWHSPAVARTVTITVTQTDYQGGPSTTLSTPPLSFTPSTDCFANMINIGEITLPVRRLAPDNITATFAVSAVSSDGADRLLDVIFADTQGQTVIVASPTGYDNLYVDAPEPGLVYPDVLGSAFDRSEAASIAGACPVIGPPLLVYPGSHNPLLLYCQEGAPAAFASYPPRWLMERTE